MIIGFASADYIRADKSHDGIEHWGGAGWVRVGQYLPFLRAAGHTVVTGVLWLEDDECLAVEDAEGVKHFPDIIICQRLMMDGLTKAFKVGRRAGQVIVNDIDDWYWGLDPSNEAFKHSHPKHNPRENTNFYKAAIAASSYLLVSTLDIKQRISNWTACPIEVFPNFVDVRRFIPVTITDTDVPEVGWAGSTLHRSGDVATLKGVLPSMARAGQIKLVHAGDWEHAPSYASQLGCEPELISRTSLRCGTEDYPAILDFEVGLVVMRDLPFNHSKSWIKGLEMSSAGIPFVAPRFGEYARLHKMWAANGEAGFYTAKNPGEWSKFLYRLKSAALRQEMQDAVLQNVQAHDIAIGAAAYAGYLESLVPR